MAGNTGQVGEHHEPEQVFDVEAIELVATNDEHRRNEGRDERPDVDRRHPFERIDVVGAAGPTGQHEIDHERSEGGEGQADAERRRPQVVGGSQDHPGRSGDADEGPGDLSGRRPFPE